MSHAVKDYISKARGAGMSNQQIVQMLAAAGWQMHDLIDIIIEPQQKEPTDSIISIKNVSKQYDKNIRALDNVSFDVARGRVTALLGPNGAGKTTLVRILTTLLQPTSGTVTIAGLDVVKDANRLRSIIGLTGQYAAVDEILTGRENLEMVGRLYHMRALEAKKRAAELLKQFDLEDAADRIAKTYSGGMRRRLDLAASLVMRPKVLFLDEPTTGLDPRSRFALWDVIRDLVKDGTTVLLTTQYLEEADQLADKIFVIDKGHIIAQGTADELKHQVGGDVLELHVNNIADAAHAAQTIKRYGDAAPTIDQTSGQITMPVSRGASVLIDVVRELDGAKIGIRNILMRRPSLDDVFMKLTGHQAE
jgi:ABC-2 type transport system ATP-binding protein